MHYSTLRDENFRTYESERRRPLRGRQLRRAKRVHAIAMQMAARRDLSNVSRNRESVIRSIQRETAFQFSWFALLWPAMQMLLKLLIPILIRWLETQRDSNRFASDGEMKNVLDTWALQAKDSLR